MQGDYTNQQQRKKAVKAEVLFLRDMLYGI
jgi:hypothetical protein